MKNIIALLVSALTLVTSGCAHRTPEQKAAAREARLCVNPAPWEVRAAAIVHYTDEDGYHSRVAHAPNGGTTRTTPRSFQYNDGNPQ